MNDIYAIRNISLKNFKCYDNSGNNIPFGHELTVIIGQNGTGKTVFLNAIKKVISIILARDRRRNIKFIGDSLNIHQNTLKDNDARYNFDFSEGGEDYEFPVQVNCEGIIRNQTINWYIEKLNKGSRSSMTFRDALDCFLAPLNERNVYAKLPVLCFFSDCYPHVRSDLSNYEKDILFTKSENPERRAGYYHWDENSADLNFWMGLFINAYEKINDLITGIFATEQQLSKDGISETKREILFHRKESLLRSQKEIEYISNILIEFTHSIKNFDNRNIEIESISVGSHISKAGKAVNAIKLNFTDGKCRYFDMLPEGHKRLFSIVFEIAYRHFLLNRNLILSDNDCKPEGIVIIDEVELHLHPSLAEEAIVRLRKTFPHIQFIVTTHSPLIVSNVYNDNATVRVLNLNRDHKFSLVENCFKADYGDTLIMAMGAYSSMRYTSVLRQRYWDALENKDNQTVETIKADLLSFIGNVNNAEQIINNILRDWGEYL